MNEQKEFELLPVLPLRGLVGFPKISVHFDVGREQSIRAVEAAMAADQRIFLLTQLDVSTDQPGFKDLYSVGTVATIQQVLKLPGDVVRVLVTGEYRASVGKEGQLSPYMTAVAAPVPNYPEHASEVRVKALCRQTMHLFDEFIDLTQRPLQDVLLKMFSCDDPGLIADLAASHSTLDYPEKMSILLRFTPSQRLTMLNDLLSRELEVLRIENELQEKTHKSIEKGQREYFLREQMRVIRDELGEGDEDAELEQYRRSLKKLELSQEAHDKLEKEIARLGKQPFGSAEAAVIRSYLDVVFALPWNKRSKERVDVAAAQKILDNDHFGLEKVKKRILEILAVKQLAPELPGQIICLVGPPGVGKTSIASSVAHALGRRLARISLGGIHDESEIRGHRKTYVGAMPGRILEAISRAGTKNPLLLLDEVDKLGSDYRGDPSAALLEVLDSEQNGSFRDHYLEIPFDLSECMFITTANTTDTIPRPLLDRMEVIELGSYTDEEKLMIAKQHLLPKQLKRHGLKRTQLRVTDDALREMIYCYTRESGVRNLEREITSLCRKADAMLVADEELKRVSVSAKNLPELLGPKKYLPDKMPTGDTVGLVTGLAWTAVGGETLQVECNVMEGSGKLNLTGNLGDVMKESVQAALSYIRSRADALGIAPDFYRTKDIHVHFPEGAVPKDGPSAGITACTAMVSALTDIPVRSDIAMTGEISIRGRVLPIGGLREKTMAALRYGVHHVIIPKENEKDLAEIDQTVRRALNFTVVEHADQVLEAALEIPVRKSDGRPKKESFPILPDTLGKKPEMRQ